VGPDLIAAVGRPAEELLVAILDPNQEVAPDGVGVVVATVDGQVRTGLVVEETPEAIRLRRAEGIEEMVPRAALEALRPTGRSLMPEGFEQVLTPQDLADLIGYLRGGESPP
jgi:putative heme-binding domain-containing protein